ncbi:ATP-binding protein [Planctomicrobium sp. SH668]|uniref:ATP-binding protein n=1 Tax=Planctomicrobium sp. SH668 TaxID=3448126 RepID=UPI003F5B01B0
MESSSVSEQPMLYDSKDLTTHALIVGMTGSGKTGLGITLLEEAAIDNIPAIVIDPKGDMGNLMLTFPNLQPNDFQPWVEPGEALRKGMNVEEYATRQALQWKEGLADWDQSPDRITRLRNAAEVAVYTPGSDAGIPLSVLKSLNAPPPAVRENADALRESTSNAVSALLSLLGVNADPLRSREHILLSNIVETAWKAGRNLDLAQLIREIQTPPFDKIGVMDLESIFPTADRRELSIAINNVLASPAFASWTQGEPLDIQNLLYTQEGKPRLAVLSIAHLNEQERMFFVTIVLNEMISWMRSQPGTSSLRAILYMDEMFGYLPPTSNPSSKTPMLTLLKQARAYGVGIVLSTQNPVDLDYKALSNAGTWFLGRLQTERDKLRVLDGLQGASEAAGVAFDRQRIETILSGLKNRVFMMNNVHEDHPVVFQVRWALSYLRGPLTREQLRTLTAPLKSRLKLLTGTSSEKSASSTPSATGTSNHLPLVPQEIKQRFLPISRSVSRDAQIVYKPALCGLAQTHYVDAKSKTDFWTEVRKIVRLDTDEVSKDPWDESESLAKVNTETSGASAAEYIHPPAECLRASTYKSWTASFKNYLYRSQVLTLSFSPDLKLYSSPQDAQGAFSARLTQQAREARDLQKEKLQQKYASSIGKVDERIRKAGQRVEVEKQQASSSTMSAAMTFGTSVLGVLFGRKTLSATNATKAATSMRAASRAMEQRGDVKRAVETMEQLQSEKAELIKSLESELNKITETFSDAQIRVEDYPINPRKSDLSVDELGIIWIPYLRSASGRLDPAYDSDLLTAVDS